MSQNMQSLKTKFYNQNIGLRYESYVKTIQL